VSYHDQDLWVHGHDGEIEHPDRLSSMTQKGYHLRIEGKPSTTNWLHFAIPTPVIIDDRRMRPIRATLLFKPGGGASVDDLHLYDGEKRIPQDDAPSAEVQSNGWTRLRVGVNTDEITSVRWGIGLSVKLGFDATGGSVDVEAAGCEFEIANQVASGRMRIATATRRTLEFPYRSNLPIDVRNEAIERVLISLHGTGGNARLYLRNGLDAAVEAVRFRVDPNALRNTLIVAPQFLDSKEYYGELPANLMHWDGGRAYGDESKERDLDGDGRPDSGTLSSFTVMDTLLDRVSRRELFPNLRRIVIAGQSNGGQFVNRYAATSTFETDVADSRGIALRYVVMNPGSYLYFDGRRAKAGSKTSFETPTGCPEYDNWPRGLANLEEPAFSWSYPKQVGAATIRAQYPGRDVIYLNGSDDNIVVGTDECEDSLQGSHRLERGEIYFNYLGVYFGSKLQHERHVVSNVRHDGHDTMISRQGREAIFSA
jgi:hypothetical protein